MQYTPEERRAKKAKAQARYELARRRFERRDLTIIEACDDPFLIGVDLPLPWRACLKALYGLPMSTGEALLYRKHTGRSDVPPSGFREASFVIGRRGRKTSCSAIITVYEALFRDHRLSLGEKGHAVVIAQNKKQAQTAMNFTLGILEGSPILSRRVERSTQWEVELGNDIIIGIWPCTIAAVRGLSIINAVCDEIAFWPANERYVNPDYEVLRAIRPAMATHPNARLLKLSTPYGKRGSLWNDFKKRPESVLVWHAKTVEMNPAITEAMLAREREEDPDMALREYDALFTDAVSAFIDPDVVDAAVVEGREELPPHPELYYYHGALDAAFKRDAFTLTIAHYDPVSECVVQDVVRRWTGTPGNPVDLDTVLDEVAALAAAYMFDMVRGDQFCSEPIRQALDKRGIMFEELTFTPQSKTRIFGGLRSLFNQGIIELLEHDRTIAELKGLECTLLPGGNYRVEAGGEEQFDDLADGLAIVTEMCTEGVEPYEEVQEPDRPGDFAM